MTQEFVTLPREVVEQALEALLNEGNFRKLRKPLIEESIKQIKAALEQHQVEQEPAIYPDEALDMGLEAIPLYTNQQPKREPLTDDDVERLWYQNRGGLWYQNQGISLRFARAIEAAHNIK